MIKASRRPRLRRARFNIAAVALIGAFAASLLFAVVWVAVATMGMTADIYLRMITSVEMSSTAALIQGAAISGVIGAAVGAATAWLCNKLGLLIEPE